MLIAFNNEDQEKNIRKDETYYILYKFIGFENDAYDKRYLVQLLRVGKDGQLVDRTYLIKELGYKFTWFNAKREKDSRNRMELSVHQLRELDIKINNIAKVHSYELT